MGGHRPCCAHLLGSGGQVPLLTQSFPSPFTRGSVRPPKTPMMPSTCRRCPLASSSGPITHRGTHRRPDCKRPRKKHVQPSPVGPCSPKSSVTQFTSCGHIWTLPIPNFHSASPCMSGCASRGLSWSLSSPRLRSARAWAPGTVACTWSSTLPTAKLFTLFCKV